ncbi:MAG: sigma-54-dependent Fis family transcriptional regulator [Planctomycetes bacterium]|nr:sigma-54-dependent Fis family transcriptional regulator [Planctomycetota bacterium]
MSIFSPADRKFADAVSKLAYCNPFLPERIAFERAALGAGFVEEKADWNLRPDLTEAYPNVVSILNRCQSVLTEAQKKAAKAGDITEAERGLYEDLVLFVLYHRYREAFDRLIDEGMAAKGPRRKIAMYEQFADEVMDYTNFEGLTIEPGQVAHVFACFFQVRRAFGNIFNYLIGASEPMVRLRAAVWQSIFTHDMRRYRRVLFDRMADYTTLVTGPSGTGKELVARAVGLSRYIPFDDFSQSFTADFAGTFYPLNLSALSATLIESELFGHTRGAFTGAVADRAGWLEVCPPLGTVFLDEIGELDPTIQVKLLRVIQSRTFNRLGDTAERRFEGKLIAATNRHLGEQMNRGVFREDLYYRLCSDIIITPSLRERLVADPTERRRLVEFIAGRLVGDVSGEVADEVERWIDEHLGPGYAWPGNVRELEQCVRNVVIRKSYHPPGRAMRSDDPRAAIAEAMLSGELTADELLRRYCTIVYAQTGSYEGAAAKLEIDRRTVKAKIDENLLARLRPGCGASANG